MTAASTGGPAARRPAVLVLRALGLGDALTAIAALRGLRRAFPDHQLALAAAPVIGEWLRGLGIVDQVVATDGLAPLRLPDDLAGGTPAGARHVAVNLHGRGPQSTSVLLATRPARLIAFRDPAGLHVDGPTWRADEHEVDRWCRLVQTAGGDCGRDDLRLSRPAGTRGPGENVVVHPGAASGSRRWPVARWVEVIRWLAADGRPVVVTGGAAERELAAEICEKAGAAENLAGTLTLDGLAEVVAGAGLLICGDTGVAHLATAFATPSVLLFGPTPPQLWGPAIDPHRHRVIWPGRAGHRYPRPAGDPHSSTIDPLLDRITVDEVIAAAAAALTRPRAAQGR